MVNGYRYMFIYEELSSGIAVNDRLTGIEQLFIGYMNYF